MGDLLSLNSVEKGKGSDKSRAGGWGVGWGVRATPGLGETEVDWGDFLLSMWWLRERW